MHTLIYVAFVRGADNDLTERKGYRLYAQYDNDFQQFDCVKLVGKESDRYGDTLPDSATETGVITDPSEATDTIETAWNTTTTRLKQHLAVLREALVEHDDEELLATRRRVTATVEPDDTEKTDDTEPDSTFEKRFRRSAARISGEEDPDSRLADEDPDYRLYAEGGWPLTTREDVDDLLDAVADDDRNVYLVPLDAHC